MAERVQEEKIMGARKKSLRWGWILSILVVYIALVVYVNIGPSGRQSTSQSTSPTQGAVKGTSLPQVFNPNANWTSRGISSQRVLRGSYGIQGSPPKGYAWVGKNASMTILNTKAMRGLLIKGYIPYSVEKRALPANHPFVVKLLINNSVVRTVIAKKDYSFTEQISRSEIERICGKAASFVVGIKSNAEVEPYRYGLNADKRHLSFIIDYVGVVN